MQTANASIQTKQIGKPLLPRDRLLKLNLNIHFHMLFIDGVYSRN